MTHICVSKLSIIGSDNGLSPGRRQAIIWTNAGILLIGPLGTNFSEILSKIHTFSFKKMHLKMLSDKWRPFCLCLNVLTELISKNSLTLSCSSNSNYFLQSLKVHAKFPCVLYEHQRISIEFVSPYHCFLTFPDLLLSWRLAGKFLQYSLRLM